MNGESYLTLLLAVCCIGAAGVSATTLDSTIEQTPDDVIDVDFSKLPIGEDQGASVKGAVQSEGSPSQAGSGDDGSPENPSDDSADSSENSDASSSEEEGAGSSESSAGGAGGETGGSDGTGSSGGSNEAGPLGSDGAGSGPGSGVTPLSLLQWLLSLLRRLLPLLVLLALAALAYRYRHHLLALGMAVAAVLGGDEGRRSTGASEWPSERPENEVHRAWLSMVAETDIEEPRTRTPSQCAAAAVEADLDPAAVRTVTDVFEEVRYGDRPVTDERRERARRGLERLDGGGSP
jgi:hypothetical protein